MIPVGLRHSDLFWSNCLTGPVDMKSWRLRLGTKKNKKKKNLLPKWFRRLFLY